MGMLNVYKMIVRAKFEIQKNKYSEFLSLLFAREREQQSVHLD